MKDYDRIIADLKAEQKAAQEWFEKVYRAILEAQKHAHEITLKLD